MTSHQESTRLVRFQLLLPSLHFALCPVMALLSASTPGGTWYRLIPLDPICALFLFSITSDFGVFALFAILGTAQWFFIGRLIDGWIQRLRASE